jgi:hypothetical protein
LVAIKIMPRLKNNNNKKRKDKRLKAKRFNKLTLIKLSQKNNK